MFLLRLTGSKIHSNLSNLSKKELASAVPRKTSGLHTPPPPLTLGFPLSHQRIYALRASVCKFYTCSLNPGAIKSIILPVLQTLIQCEALKYHGIVNKLHNIRIKQINRFNMTLILALHIAMSYFQQTPVSKHSYRYQYQIK